MQVALRVAPLLPAYDFEAQVLTGPELIQRGASLYRAQVYAGQVHQSSVI